MENFKNSTGLPGEPPTDWQSQYGGSAWEYVPDLKKWYLHFFDVSRADLNWDNPKVRQELRDVFRFWKNKEVKGYPGTTDVRPWVISA